MTDTKSSGELNNVSAPAPAPAPQTMTMTQSSSENKSCYQSCCPSELCTREQLCGSCICTLGSFGVVAAVYFCCEAGYCRPPTDEEIQNAPPTASDAKKWFIQLMMD